ncbi:MAG: hypothetical protein AAGA92_08860 [Planctomycetota bacterium]
MLQQALTLAAAPADLGEAVYAWSRLDASDDPRALLGLIACVATLLLLWIGSFYLRDTRSLGWTARVVLFGLRLTAIAGLIVYFLQPERRFDRTTTDESVVAVLIDASQSMSIQDEPGEDGGNIRRSDAASDWVAQPALLNALAEKNDVEIYTFGAEATPVASLARGTTLETSPDWLTGFQPTADETRLGDALAETARRRPTAPLAGVVVLSDGRATGGAPPADAVTALSDQAAARGKPPVFTIGLGSSEPRRNARVAGIELPSRATPDDQVPVTVSVAAEGLAGETATLELRLAPAGAQPGEGELLGRESIALPADGVAMPVRFVYTPTEPGASRLTAQLVGHSRDPFPADDSRGAALEVIARKTNVLLIAGAANRDYRFLRNQLDRDEQTRLSVWLQLLSGPISQDADELLAAFPDSAEQLFEFDCIVAFDPDWTRLDADQIALLERWVADEAGGLVVSAGPVHTAAWTQSSEHAVVRSLYPVEYQKRLTLLDDGVYGSTKPWPIKFTDAGREAPFLRIADTAEESDLAWSRFPGVFGCYAVRGPKPGAQVLARYSNPDAGLSRELPAYIAEHFYGAGRVVYIGSSEWWRLRAVEPAYFDILYTKLIRHASQGRLLRGSSIVMLQADRQAYTVGDDATLRARLLTPSREPLELPTVEAESISPGGAKQKVLLAADPDRPGHYVGQLPLSATGQYEVTQFSPGTTEEAATVRFRVELPDLEFRETRRDEAVLAALADQSGGRYYRSPADAAEGTNENPPLADLLVSRAETRVLRGRPDPEFARQSRGALLSVICGALICEWLLRRLLKLS